MALAALTAIIWGLAFVAIPSALESFSPPQVTTLRFVIACLPVFFLPRPRLPWRRLVLIGLTLFTGQFLLLFFAYAQGLPAGLASVTQQLQAIFTVLLAAFVLRDRPTPRQVIGMAIAFGGIGLIATTVGQGLPAIALVLAVAAAFSWAIGNLLVKAGGPMPMLPLIAWLSLVPPLPALLVSVVSDGGLTLPAALAAASWQSMAAVFYLGAIATTLAYAVWGRLLASYPAALVAPFALLAPCVGIGASAVALGERFRPAQYGGMALILIGVAVSVFPVQRFRGAIDAGRPSP
jgi:O-acetylserine/cysteine efflux transporter